MKAKIMLFVLLALALFFTVSSVFAIVNVGSEMANTLILPAVLWIGAFFYFDKVRSEKSKA